jgi:hypothetical protein
VCGHLLSDIRHIGQVDPIFERREINQLLGDRTVNPLVEEGLLCLVKQCHEPGWNL